MQRFYYMPIEQRRVSVSTFCVGRLAQLGAKSTLVRYDDVYGIAMYCYGIAELGLGKITDHGPRTPGFAAFQGCSDQDRHPVGLAALM